MKYAWYGKKFSTCLLLMMSGAGIYRATELAGDWYVLAIFIAISLVLGVARETPSADGYWFMHNRIKGKTE